MMANHHVIRRPQGRRIWICAVLLRDRMSRKKIQMGINLASELCRERPLAFGYFSLRLFKEK
jgi:hypothetical protein